MHSQRPSGGYARKNATMDSQQRDDDMDTRRHTELQRVKETQRRRAAMRKAKADLTRAEENRRKQALDERKNERSMLSAYMKAKPVNGTRRRVVTKPLREVTTLPGRFCESPTAAPKLSRTVGRLGCGESIQEDVQTLMDSLDLHTSAVPPARKVDESVMVDSLDLDSGSLIRLLGQQRNTRATRHPPWAPQTEKKVRWALPESEAEVVDEDPRIESQRRGDFNDTKPLHEYLHHTSMHNTQPPQRNPGGEAQQSTLQAPLGSRKPSRLVAPGSFQREVKPPPKPPKPVPENPPQHTLEPTGSRSVHWRVLSSPASVSRGSLAVERQRRRERDSVAAQSVVESEETHVGDEETHVGESSTSMFLRAEEMADQSCLSATHILSDLLETAPKKKKKVLVTTGSLGSFAQQCSAAEANYSEYQGSVGGVPMGKTLLRLCSEEEALMRSLQRLDGALMAKVHAMGNQQQAQHQQHQQQGHQQQHQRGYQQGCQAAQQQRQQQRVQRPKPVSTVRDSLESPRSSPEPAADVFAPPKPVGVSDFSCTGVLEPAAAQKASPVAAGPRKPVTSEIRSKLGALKPPSGRVRRGGGRTNRQS